VSKKEIHVYRVQDRYGRGPWKPGFSHRWSDPELAPGQEELLPVYEEFGLDVFHRLGRANEFYGTAVRSPEALCRWFSASEQCRLSALGYSAVSLGVDRILAESKHQLVFARREPLRIGALVIQWPKPCVEDERRG
jgi:hypothetical protein